MKINFWSSTEYTGFLAGLIRELNSRGLEASQRYRISETSYRAAKSPAARLFLRFRQYVAYPIQLIAALTMNRIRRLSGQLLGNFESTKPGKEDRGHGVIVVSTNTFYAPLIATYLHPHVVHLVYDLFPEAMIHSGKWREGSPKVKLVRWVARKTLQRCKVNVFLGERLKDYVESIHGPVPNAAIIPVGADQSLFPASPKQRRGRNDEDSLTHGKSNQGQDPKARHLVIPHCSSDIHAAPTVLYCGNFGNLHDSATLFAYWSRSATPQRAAPSEASGDDSNTQHLPAANDSAQTRKSARYVFHCSGPKRAALEGTVKKLPKARRAAITVRGGLPQKEWIEAMEAADVALVMMTPGAETVVMPSKTYSAMMAGQAILAIAPENSDLAELIKKADCGWWVEPGDVGGLATTIQTIESDPEGLLAKRERAYHYAHEHLGQDALAKEWLKALKTGSAQENSLPQ